MKVLFLSVSIGGGHLKAAEALKEYIEDTMPDSNSMIVDTLNYINPIVDKLIVGSYINTLKATPFIYKLLYGLSESDDKMNTFSKSLNRLLASKIKRLVEIYNPDVIVCTHPFPLQMISTLKKKGKLLVPVLAVITDYTVHPFWIHSNIDAYVVSNKYMKLFITEKMGGSNNIFDFGIPVSKKFLSPLDKTAILNDLNLPQKPIVLIMGGSLGFGDIKDIFYSLISCDLDLQIIAVTGRNSKLERALKRECLKHRKEVRIFSFTDKIPELMEIADFLITKPGGLTIAEALVKGIPLLLSSPIPGVEERNFQYLINNGAACNISLNENISESLLQLLDNPLRIKHMKEASKHLSRPDSCKEIVSLMENLIS